MSANTPLRLLVVLPTWVGDVCMATPTLRLLRERYKGSFLGVLARPGSESLIDNAGLFDEVHVAKPEGVMGPKRLAQMLRPRRYDTALLLPNSFSTALIARIAGIPNRIGYERDARSFLLTRTVKVPRTPDGRWLPVSLHDYHYNLVARTLFAAPNTPLPDPNRVIPLPAGRFLELTIDDAEREAGRAVIARAGLSDADDFAMLTPGANNDAKHWPVDRFAALARHLVDRHALPVLVNGAPRESDLANELVRRADRPGRVIALPALGLDMHSLKALIARASLMVTNDTGPRHMGAALGTPLVSLFGPTDYRLASVPTRGPEIVLKADPSLPLELFANDFPDRCSMDRIEVKTVLEAADQVLGRVASRATTHS
ncbi:MAG: lipopolysaccharide heptosyltransferase II [Phycisphaerales bacterium]|nr:MAG: lipopolysaccharide heptosyltransferase II [Phycisphaerales bacterium]